MNSQNNTNNIWNRSKDFLADPYLEFKKS